MNSLARCMLCLLVFMSFSCNTNNKVSSDSSTQNQQTVSVSDSTGSSVGVYGVASDPDNPCGMKSAFNLLPESAEDDTSFGIVGGKAARVGDLVTKSTVKVILPGGHCTGTLIGLNSVLTAAHCFQVSSEDSDANNLNFLTDPSDVSLGFGLGGAAIDGISVTSFALHPNYRGILATVNENGDEVYANQVFYDVALITFSGSLPSDYIPVTIGDSALEIVPNTLVSVAGYGAYSEQDRSLRPLSAVDTQIDEVNDYKEIQLKVNGKGACYGDSGGPTYIYPEDRSCLKLVGSTTGPGRKSDYSCAAGSGTMMDVTSYRAWIKCTLSEMGSPLSYLPSTDRENSQSACGNNLINL